MKHELIFDRTIDDVKLAKKIRSEKFLRGIKLTQEESDIMERGILTINTINRIEANQNQIWEFLQNIGYWNINIENKKWNNTDLFVDSDSNRLINNIEILIEGFFTYSNTPGVPSTFYDYKSINDIEKIIHDLHLMIMDVTENYRECGNIECGGD